MFSKKKDIKAIILQLGRIWRTTDLSEEQITKKNALLKRLNFRFAGMGTFFIASPWDSFLRIINFKDLWNVQRWSVLT